MLAVLLMRDCTLLRTHGPTKAGLIRLTMPGKLPRRVTGRHEHPTYHVEK